MDKIIFVWPITICSHVANADSSTLPVLHGVPQGSLLAPLLFMLYINDIYKFILSGTVVLYADDTSIIIEANSLEELLIFAKDTVSQIETYCSQNRLKLNANKSNIMVFPWKK